MSLRESEYNIRRKTSGEAAEREARDLADRSHLQRVSDPNVRLNLSWNDILIEQPIGFGGFSQVFRVRLNGNPYQHYALKCLNPQIKLKTQSFTTGAIDLAVEGEILSRLDHKNIIKLHGISISPVQSFLEADRGYFIVLDLLYDTLASKLDKYRSCYKVARSGGGGGMSKFRSNATSMRKHMTSSAVLERVSAVAIGVAKGMEYLHSQRVALRDLKPDNVGFDEQGTVKIFDFGFAREEHTIEPNEMAGSLRYMAPEVARGHGSLLISDVYSFGVLLWEICTLEKPYKHINSREEFMESIIVDEWRPTTSKIPSDTLRELIKQCWQSDPPSRPSFSQVVKKLRVEIAMTKTSQIGSIATSPNQGFGSSDNLKRTATWTAKTFTSSISQSTLGVIRMGFRSSNESLSNLNEGVSTTVSGRSVADTRVESTRIPQGRMGWAKRRSNSRSKSPINALFGPAATARGGRLTNATFGRSLLLGEKSSSMTRIPHAVHHEDESVLLRNDADTGTATSGGLSHPNPPSLRRGLPSAPVMLNY